MLESLKEAVWEANMRLVREGLVRLTWGNVSGIDREAGIFGIKPSGVSYDDLRPEMITLVDLEGAVVEGVASRTRTRPAPRRFRRRVDPCRARGRPTRITFTARFPWCGN